MRRQKKSQRIWGQDSVYKLLIYRIRGAGGSRTRVQTCCKDAFYMLSQSVFFVEREVLCRLYFRLSSVISLGQRSLPLLSNHLRCFLSDADWQSFRRNIRNIKPCLSSGNRAVKQRLHKCCHLLATRVSF